VLVGQVLQLGRVVQVQLAGLLGNNQLLLPQLGQAQLGQQVHQLPQQQLQTPTV
jgi:hypothetical protein